MFLESEKSFDIYKGDWETVMSFYDSYIESSKDYETLGAKIGFVFGNVGDYFLVTHL